ncbi:alpha/beta fold hydrolase [Luedemannella helvata]|uniref:alpha/beta fold hydrolase n=1 Tax=Luedemannella helvata TaxID=349315 RepID=UPI0031CDB460
MRRVLAGVLVVVGLLSVGAAATAAPVRALSWGTCDGLSDPRLRCATVSVPLDYAKPHGRRIDITLSRLPAADPALRRGVLLMTSGGPGNAGVPLPGQYGQVLDQRVLDRYDLVGFDIRFLERSTPVSCGQPAEEPGGYWVRVHGHGTLAEHANEAKEYARDCVRHAGWALPHATTANVARDMDTIRAALGETRVSYLGGSYAGLVGEVYATLFPHRVDRMVLDSANDADRVWRPFEVERTAAMERTFEAFTAYVAANPAYGLGATPAEVTAALRGLLARAPVTAGGQAFTHGELGYLMLLAEVQEQLWPVAAVNLAAIAAGAAPPVPVPLRPTTSSGAAGVPADNHTAVNMMFRCGDGAWPRQLAAYAHDLDFYGSRYPNYGPANANITPCAFWPATKDTIAPLAGRKPVLLTAALHDAIVPIANARAVQRAMPGSRLVTIDARYHAPFPYAGNVCLNGAVTDYLATGVLPAQDVGCMG